MSQYILKVPARSYSVGNTNCYTPRSQRALEITSKSTFCKVNHLLNCKTAHNYARGVQYFKPYSSAVQARRWQISMGGAEPPKFPKITPFCKGPPLPPYKNFLHGGGHGPPSPPLSDGLGAVVCH